MSRFPAVGGGGDSYTPVSFKDRAETFNESDVTLSHSDTVLSNGSVTIGNKDGTTARPGGFDGGPGSNSASRGAEFVPQTDLGGVRLQPHPNSGGFSVYWLVDSDLNILAESSSSELYAQLKAGETYYAGLWDNGSDWNFGYQYNVSYPVTSGDINITAGVKHAHPEDGSNVNSTGGDVEGLREITALLPVESGSVTVEWPQPTDIYRWDAASFTKTADGSSVEVFIEESNDGGSTWTEIAGPISRGQDISADPDSRVRYRVDLSRTDVSNKPTLDSIYRRWVV